MSWSNKMRELRFEMGEMTQRELAERVGVSRQTINAIETNKHAPSLELAFRIADVFETSVEDVFFYKPDIEGENELPDNVIIEVSWDDDGDNGGT